MPTTSSSRPWGLLLIGLVLLVAAVIPNARTRTVTGIPQAAPVTGPPTVGDCVTDPIDPGWDTIGAHRATLGTYLYPRVGIEACQGTRYGEITAVITDPTKPVVTTTASGNTSGINVDDANMDTCRSAGYRYVGIALAKNQPAPILAGWYPLLMIATAASTPSIRQQAAGQHWLACIVYLRVAAESPPFADQERYGTSIRNALFTGQERDRTGLCVAAAELDERAAGEIGCAADHRSEIFALGITGTHPVARSDLQLSCRRVVARLTNLATLTAAGLTVQMLATDSDQAPITSGLIPAVSNLSCGVTSNDHRTLAGSVLALGSQPVPWK